LLAGLISKEDRSTANRIPGLGDLPVAGRLFSSQKDDGQRTELVLAITPRIVHPAARPDISQAEMWVGSETSTRLRPAPALRAPSSAATAEKSTSENARPQVAGPPAGSGEALARPSSAPSRPAGEASSGPATLTVSWHAPAEVAAGEVFEARLDLATSASLRSLPLEIRFPADTVEVVGVNEGTLFRRGGTAASFTHAVGPGRISVGVLSSDSSGARGNGSLLSLKLKATKPGPLELTLSSFSPSSSASQLTVGELPVLKIQAK
jgi:general secretion pathway protein D